MAIGVYVQRESGTTEQPSLPVVVAQDPPAFLTYADAVTALNAAAGTTVPTSIAGVPNDGNPGIRRLGYSAWEFMIRYAGQGARPIKAPDVGEFRAGFQWHAPRKFVQFAPEIAKFPSGAPPSRNIVGLVADKDGYPVSSGAWIEPPQANLSYYLSVAPSSVTGSWVKSLAALMGAANSTTLTSGSYAIGEICLVSAVGSRIANNAFTLDLGWNYTANVSGETRDTVTGVAYYGQDYVSDYFEKVTDRDNNQIAWKIIATYVHRVRTFANLTTIGIQPPG